jgi:hypothetical protein
LHFQVFPAKGEGLGAEVGPCEDTGMLRGEDGVKECGFADFVVSYQYEAEVRLLVWVVVAIHELSLMHYLTIIAEVMEGCEKM